MSKIKGMCVATLRADAAVLQSGLVQLRRRLHLIPEIGLELPTTRAEVLAALDPLGLEITTYDSMSGVTAVLRGVEPGEVVLLRADMDALPVTEGTGSAFAFDGPRMHACGHDLHMAMLVGAARLLGARRSSLRGSVVFMFQPGEEGYFGARHMIEAGVLDAAGERAAAAYALHVAPGILRGGDVATRPGPLLAATDRLRVVVLGASGHGARPHLALDPVPVAAEIVLALQSAITRRFDIFDPVVLSVGAISAGSEHNIIADSAHLDATIRTFSASARAEIAGVVTRVCDGIARAHGLRAETVVEPLYPATINHPAEAARIVRVAGDLFGSDHVHEFDRPLPGSEDFSHVLDVVPGAMAFFGVCPPDRDPANAPYNHSTRVVHDDTRLGDGAALLAALALDRLDQSGVS